MVETIGLEDIDDLVMGASFLGTGGGGDPFIGAMLCREALRRYGPVTLLSLDALPDDAQVFVAAGMGAPTVLIEKLFSLDDVEAAVSALERHLDRRATAVIAAEVGGVNSMVPLAFAARRGIPLIDGDGLGRAFPSIDMIAFNIAGISCTPLTLTDERGSCVTIEAGTARLAEELARPVVATMGGSASLSCYPMNGAQTKAAAIPATLTAARNIGRAIRSGAGHPIDRLIASLDANPLYAPARRIFDGKVVALERNTTGGWSRGECRLAGTSCEESAALHFQNEFLSIALDDGTSVLVPDLISLVDTETGVPIPAERVAYGQRVTVIACAAPAALRTRAALEVVGPAAFGLPGQYRSLADRKPEPAE